MLLRDNVAINVDDKVPPDLICNARAARGLEHFVITFKGTVDALNQRALGYRHSFSRWHCALAVLSTSVDGTISERASKSWPNKKFNDENFGGASAASGL